MAQQVSEEKFLQIYGNLLVQTWAFDELKQRFKKNPAQVLKDFGLDPGTAKVNIIPPWDEPDPEKCTPESQYRMWKDGLASGSIDFVYPEQPPEGGGGEQLSMDQLEAISGGGYYCCCCSPCCCCS